MEVKHSDGLIESVVFQDGTEESMNALYIRPPFQHNFSVDQLQLLHPRQDGLPVNEAGYIIVDPKTQKTPIDGVMACGDCTTPNRALSIAIASGTKAAKMLNYELSLEDWDGL